ncbi:MAG TPA: hypothetical protein VGG41_01765 [Solirubrobacteraceae bacterium]
MSSVTIDAVGAAGSAYGSNSTASGLGDGVSGTVSGLTGGTSTLFVCVDQGGGTSILTDIDFPGGVGGGASGVSLGSDFSQPVVVAGGGGGGGNSAGGPAAGGDAGEPVAGAGANDPTDSAVTGGGGGDNTTSSGGAAGSGGFSTAGSGFNASGPGAGGDSTIASNPHGFPPAYTGGSGGGGYYGGGAGGDDASTHGGGGGGGSDYCVDTASLSSCTVSTGAGAATVAGSSAGDAQVTLTYANPPVACTAGSYSASGFTPCTLAPPGSYVPGTGATSPTSCSPGTYQSNSGKTSCDPASVGFYVSGSGQTTQTACPAGETTLTTGSTSMSACFGATKLTAAPELDLAHLALGVGANVVSATLTGGGQPVPNESISFSAGALHLCTAKTNSKGVASCRLSPTVGLLVVLTGHYSASFAGATPYEPSSASTPTIVF